MAKDDIRLEGFAELDKALAEIGKKSTERALLRRVAKKALRPVLEQAKANAPVDEGRLRDSIVMGSRLTSSAKKIDRRSPRQGLRLFVGTAIRNAVPREFGTWRTRATPFMRPAWEKLKGRVLQIVISEMGPEIERTAERAAKRATKKRKAGK